LRREARKVRYIELKRRAEDRIPVFAMTKDIHNSFNKRGSNHGMEEWDRWDEDLVEDFGRWLGLVGKAFGIVLLLAAVTGLGTWLWQSF